MKKTYLLFFLFGLFCLSFLYGCKQEEKINIDEIADKIVEEINLPTNSIDNLPFKSFYKINEINANVTYHIDYPEIINSNGIITRGFEDKEVNIEIQVTINDEVITRNLGKIIISKYSEEEILDELKKVFLPDTVTSDINFPTTFEIFGKVVNLTWNSSNKEALSDEGKVYFKEELQTSTISVGLEIDKKPYYFTIKDVTIPIRTALDHINSVISKIEIPDSISSSINLPKSLDGVQIFWKSLDPRSLSDTGIWRFQDTDTNTTLIATFIYNGKYIDKTYPITVLTIPYEDRISQAFSTIDLPNPVDSNLNLPTSFEYNVTGSWSTSDNNIISTNGLVNFLDYEQNVVLTLTLYSGDEFMTKNYNLTIKAFELNKDHILLNYSEDMNLETANNLILENGKIILGIDATLGYYDSPVYPTALGFDRLIGSWSAITNQNSTCELQIKVLVNGVWSDYLSYSKWGLGLQNALFDQNLLTAQMSDDEILIKNGQKAISFQYRITLRRNSLSDPSPKLSLVAISLSLPGYTYPVNISNIPEQINYDVPMLYQHDVPVIGNSICSITSSTMLLQYKGHTFTDTLPHREVAALFYDYGNKIYGNWVYNTVGMGAYGENSYVKRIYSLEELLYHLATVGPVALSIRGDTGLYTTAGHLIVVRGYKIVDGNITILSNDPNVKGVYVEYSKEVILRVSRNIIYVIE